MNPLAPGRWVRAMTRPPKSASSPMNDIAPNEFLSIKVSPRKALLCRKSSMNSGRGCGGVTVWSPCYDAVAYIPDSLSDVLVTALNANHAALELTPHYRAVAHDFIRFMLASTVSTPTWKPEGTSRYSLDSVATEYLATLDPENVNKTIGYLGR